MAEYNEILTGRFNRLAQRLLQIKADPPVRILGSELSPGITFESERLEWEHLKGARLMAIGTTVSAAALQPSAFRLRNPSTSGVIAVVQLLIVTANPAAIITLRRGEASADFATVENSTSRDSRLVNQNSGACLVSIDNTGAALSGGFVGRIVIDTNVPFRFENLAVLAPGSNLDVYSGNNVRLDAVLWWSERAIEDSERA